MKTRTMFHASSALILALTVVTGCSSGKPSSDREGEAQIDSIGQEPITLTVFQEFTGITDEEFNRFIAEPVKKKFPQVTMQLVRSSQGKTIENMVSSGEFPDLIYASSFDTIRYTGLSLLADLNANFKKYNFDLGKFEQSAINEVKLYADNGQFYMMPLFMNFASLYYNKDIFDKFAVPYPKDGMTWEEVLELSRKITRSDNGQDYYALGFNGAPRLAVSFLLPVVDAKTNKALFTNSGTNSWKRFFELMKAFNDIPGNKLAGFAEFGKNRNVAMLASYGARLGEFEDLHKKGTPLNWDMVTFPGRQEEPLVVETEVHGLMVTTASKHQDEAFKVAAWLTQKEMQLEMAKYGKLTALKDPDVKQAFGANLETLKGKNVQAIFKNKYGKNPPRAKYYDVAVPHMVQAIQDVYKGNTDINTALRDAEEKANKAIQDQIK
ncbi:hypothetical protein PAESOLCIP111_00994 [Paenibacillus solanacearum]|uniref:Extracellular solute-binding protein n=1 Tax=Paenibacillus solanacearum TaxID=2048548 RepID=A0A916NMQ7_9BACL|nr:extracellular solute-binding protein [Paenibacillus solanacearum]CAG7607773.1 hypothetical protein PAESOLCIP111_00994 [Paenibacillus solanacearum]